MQPLLYGYLPILVFLVIAGGIAVAMLGGSLLAAHQKPYAEKLTAYECGFEAFDDARRRFDVRYYLVAILFIIFDLCLLYTSMAAPSVPVRNAPGKCARRLSRHRPMPRHRSMRLSQPEFHQF